MNARLSAASAHEKSHAMLLCRLGALGWQQHPPPDCFWLRKLHLVVLLLAAVLYKLVFPIFIFQAVVLPLC